MTSQQFDSIQYKEAALKQWQEVARGWHEWRPLFTRWGQPATERMLDLAGIGPESRVLDLGAGVGDQSMQAAERVGPNGYVLATDISPNMLAFAAEFAREAGLTQLETRVMDAEQLELPDASFDGVVSRLLLMLLPNVDRALAEIHRVLKPGGRMAAIVFSTPDKSPWIAVPAAVAREHAQLPPPEPDRPGLFRLGIPGVFEGALRDAGFRDVAAHTAYVPLRLASADECLRFVLDVSTAIQEMLAGLDDDGKRQAFAAIVQTLRQYEGPDGFESPCEVIIGTGSK